MSCGRVVAGMLTCQQGGYAFNFSVGCLILWDMLNKNLTIALAKILGINYLTIRKLIKYWNKDTESQKQLFFFLYTKDFRYICLKKPVLTSKQVEHFTISSTRDTRNKNDYHKMACFIISFQMTEKLRRKEYFHMLHPKSSRNFLHFNKL